MKYKDLLKIVLIEDCCFSYCKYGKIDSYGSDCIHIDKDCGRKFNYKYFEFDIDKFYREYPQYKEIK